MNETRGTNVGPPPPPEVGLIATWKPEMYAGFASVTVWENDDVPGFVVFESYKNVPFDSSPREVQLVEGVAEVT